MLIKPNANPTDEGIVDCLVSTSIWVVFCGRLRWPCAAFLRGVSVGRLRGFLAPMHTMCPGEELGHKLVQLVFSAGWLWTVPLLHEGLFADRLLLDLRGRYVLVQITALVLKCSAPQHPKALRNPRRCPPSRPLASTHRPSLHPVIWPPLRAE